MDAKVFKTLTTVSKPTRYLGDELNVVKKRLNDPELVRVALAFPDIYDVGMSHLGLKILYHILNSRDDVWAERVYAPWIDMEEKIKGVSLLFSLESSSPLKDFDIIGFSLQYEMSYTNVLNMLDLAQIPLLSADRDGSHPLIIAGGPCVFNPEPMADFVDFFVVGDGEEVITEIVDCYKSNKDRERYELLSKMAEIDGIYVPSFASLKKQPDGTMIVAGYPVPDVLGFTETGETNPEPDAQVERIRKRIVRNLNNAKYPVDYMVPFMKPIHDRAIVEIMRGCSRGCRFCQAGMIYRPVRERSTDVVERLAHEIINKTGYEELSLSSLSTCDHSSISEILQRLIESPGKDKHVSISLPSLRADTFSVKLARQLESIGKTGLTFAPEVATDRMQNVINKCIPRSELISTVESAFSSGWDSLKLYFMIGLPTEMEEDVLEIARLIKEVLKVALRINRRANLSVSISNFVPKAHTPFQWERQSSLDEIQQKQKLITGEVGRSRRITLSFTAPQVSYLEGVFARGDRRLGQVLLFAHTLGCKLDGWSELFDFNRWKQAFAQCGIDPDVYLMARKRDQIMPWDHIDPGVTKDFLLAERDRAYRVELTPDCRLGRCSRCGISDILDAGCWMLDTLEFRHETQGLRLETPVSNLTYPVSRIRFQFAKREAVKFISHLDLLSAFTRAFRRAGIPIAYSHGFNPNPKIVFGTVLPVGTASEAEYADIDLDSYMKPEDFISQSNSQLPSGLEILRAAEVSLKAQPLMSQVNLSSYNVRVSGIDKAPGARISSILNMDHVWIERPYKSHKVKTEPITAKYVDVKSLIRNIRLLVYMDNTMELEMLLGDGNAGKVRPEEVTQLILDELAEAPEREDMLTTIEIQKTGSFIEYQGQLFSPFDVIINDPC